MGMEQGPRAWATCALEALACPEDFGAEGGHNHRGGHGCIEGVWEGLWATEWWQDSQDRWWCLIAGNGGKGPEEGCFGEACCNGEQAGNKTTVEEGTGQLGWQQREQHSSGQGMQTAAKTWQIRAQMAAAEAARCTALEASAGGTTATQVWRGWQSMQQQWQQGSSNTK